MDVKLHKGPLHGKTYAFAKDQTDIIISHLDRGGMLTDWREPTITAATLNTRNLRYRMKMMNHPKWGMFPAVDPDGRIFFEYVP